MLVKRLARKADVFLTNLLPSRLAKFGLDYKHIHEINPKVVYSSVSGWGLNGPSPSKLAFDMTAFFARGGVMGVLGTPGAPPVKPRSGQGDHQTGLAALSSILAALLLRARTGQGSLCEASLNRTATWNLGEDLAATLVDRIQPKKSEPAKDAVMQRPYHTRDGRWLLPMMPFREHVYWPNFCKAVGKPEWVTGEVYDTVLKRWKGREQLGGAIQDIFDTDDLQPWLDKLEAAGCIAGPIAELPEVCADPALRANGAFVTVKHPIAGEFETVAAPFNIRSVGGAPIQPNGPGPEVGADTAAVLLEKLSMGASEVAELQKAGVVGVNLIKDSAIAIWTSKL